MESMIGLNDVAGIRVICEYIHDVSAVRDALLSGGLLEFLDQEICEQEEQTENVDRLVSKVRKYPGLDEVAPSALNDMGKAECVRTPDQSKDHRKYAARHFL